MNKDSRRTSYEKFRIVKVEDKNDDKIKILGQLHWFENWKKNKSEEEKKFKKKGKGSKMKYYDDNESVRDNKINKPNINESNMEQRRKNQGKYFFLKAWCY